MDIKDLYEKFVADLSSRGISIDENELMQDLIANTKKTKVKEFAKNILDKQCIKYSNFLESENVNGMIWAPTQIGKSEASRYFMMECFKKRVPVIVSTDNKTDQCEQLYYRTLMGLEDNSVQLIKVIDKKFVKALGECVKQNKNFVIFCLDNASQIEKMRKAFKDLYVDDKLSLSKIAIIHDEGDTITKDPETNKLVHGQALSHKRWLEFVGLFKKTNIELKRIFVTATPENCCMLYNIQSVDVMSLGIPSEYKGYKDIEYNELTDDTDAILLEQVRRIKSENKGEVILYCVDRKIANGQDIALARLSQLVRCTVCTYNGNGISVIFTGIRMYNKFCKELYDLSLVYQCDKELKQVCVKKLSIRKFYKLCKLVGEKCVVTIGKDLIARGISYVGEDKSFPLAATTIIYKPGATMHAVGITQTIGRVTGCARPELKRRVYAPLDVIDTYKRYNENQEMYIKEILHKTMDTTKQVIDSLEFKKYKRSIDKPKLKKHVKMNWKEETDEFYEDNHLRMQELVKRWWGASTIIGQILQFVYDNERVSEKDLKEFIKGIGAYDTWYNDLHTSGKNYSIVFTRDTCRYTCIKKEAKNYIEK